MGSLALRAEARAWRVECSDVELTVYLVDGRSITAPLAWFPRLLHATPEQRGAWELLGDGDGVHWQDVDEDISVAGLLRGEPSGEVQ